MKSRLPAMCLAFCAAASIGSDTAEDATLSLQSRLRICRSVASRGERLICYDRVAALEEFDDGPQADISPQGLFGASQRHAASPVEGRDVTTLSGRVRSLSRAANNALLIDLDNGQVWRQEGSAELMLAVGDVVVVSRGALSSFHLATPTGRKSRVTRIK